MQNIQTILDEHKQDIPSGVYLELCNALRDQHQRDSQRTYKVTYLCPATETHVEVDGLEEDVNYLKFTQCNETVILSNEEVKVVQEHIQSKGYACPHVIESPLLMHGREHPLLSALAHERWFTQVVIVQIKRIE